MSADVMQRLRDADPADRDVEAPGDLLAALMAEPRSAPTSSEPRRPPRRPRVRLLTAAGAAAALMLAVVVVAGVGHAPDARAQLVAAAERTATFTSGQITWHTVVDPPISTFHADSTRVSRFDGRDVATETTSAGANAGTPSATRFVDGRMYVRVGDTGSWKQEDPSTIPDAGRPSDRLQDELAVADALAAVARRAPDVRRDERDDEVRFHAVVDASQLPTYGMGGPRWPAGPVQVDVLVAADDTIRRMTLSAPGETWEVTFAELGEPQDIPAP